MQWSVMSRRHFILRYFILTVVPVIEPGTSCMLGKYCTVQLCPRRRSIHFTLQLHSWAFPCIWGMFSLSHFVVQGDLELLDSSGYLKPYNTALEQTQPYLMNLEYKLLRLCI